MSSPPPSASPSSPFTPPPSALRSHRTCARCNSANAGFATMADLKRKLNILQHLSPAISEKQPRTQTKCGGLLMMTLFPIAVVIYSLVVQQLVSRATVAGQLHVIGAAQGYRERRRRAANRRVEAVWRQRRAARRRCRHETDGEGPDAHVPRVVGLLVHGVRVFRGRAHVPVGRRDCEAAAERPADGPEGDVSDRRRRVEHGAREAGKGLRLGAEGQAADWRVPLPDAGSDRHVHRVLEVRRVRSFERQGEIWGRAHDDERLDSRPRPGRRRVAASSHPTAGAPTAAAPGTRSGR